MDIIEKNKWQEGWYEIGQKLTNNMICALSNSISNAIDELKLEIKNKSGSADQLKFFDYIYPSISQRLTSLEASILDIKIILAELKAEKNMNIKDEEIIDFDFLFKRIDDLDFMTVRTVTALTTQGFEYIGDIICNQKLKRQQRDPEWNFLLKIPNLGKISFRDILATLKKWGYDKPILCEEYWDRREKKTGKAWGGEI